MMIMTVIGTGRHLVACYGSLKEGFYNHPALGADAKLMGYAKVSGVMYLCGSYPHLYHSDGSTEELEFGETPFAESLERQHVVEVYEINSDAFRSINNMELGAGYSAETLDTEWGAATVYITDPECYSPRLEWIEAYTKEKVYG